MKYLRKFLVVIALMTFVGSSAFAATNIYEDTYTTENSSGAWTFTNFSDAGKTIPVVTITGPTDTTSSVTAARTGYLYILTASAGPAVGGVGYTMLLPTAAAGLNYRFITATNQTISVKSGAGDAIVFGNAGHARATSAASTGCTIALLGASGKWYVTSMTSPGSGHDDWTMAAS